MRDSLDGAIDMSDFLIDMHGFIPVPTIITEPALGGFGFGLAPVFLTPKKRLPDTPPGQYVRPDITAGFGMWTVNGSWAAGAVRSGTLQKQRIRYVIGGGYADVNLSFYHTFENIGEQEFKFNFQVIPIILRVTKQIAHSEWYAGGQYLFANIKVHYGDTLPEFVQPREINSNISALAPMVEYDNRDNIFTPHKGLKAHFEAMWSDDAIGSDYDLWRANGFAYYYQPLAPEWTLGFRFDVQQVWGDPPFYMLPFISMRGIPVGRYQGRSTLLGETEVRWDFVRRWSAVGFTGAGKAFDEWDEFGDAEVRWMGGAGFRYLLARKFGVRMGIDIARGPEVWAWYIVFGSSWLK
ncbi:MAG TPA: BamA/TamA family outer membrane protein [Saprospiraceae bacterium]|nr:BamA/TamA family outer membrane protein [Saprospiraceae bacterium]